MMESFNPKLLFANIEYLIKSEHRKIGEVESQAGVSAGYISRTGKDGGSRPGIDFIMNIARVLHVSVDTLLQVELASLTPTEHYVLSFLEKLKRNTRQEALAWERVPAGSLNNLKYGLATHPLFDLRTFREEKESRYPEEVSRLVFVSRSFDVHTTIHGDCFQLELQNGACVHLMNISKSHDHLGDRHAVAKEVWMSLPREEPQYLGSDYQGDKLAAVIHSLYEEVAANTKHPKLKPAFRHAIDSFMRSGNKDDIPF